MRPRELDVGDLHDRCISAPGQCRPAGRRRRCSQPDSRSGPSWATNAMPRARCACDSVKSSPECSAMSSDSAVSRKARLIGPQCAEPDMGIFVKTSRSRASAGRGRGRSRWPDRGRPSIRHAPGTSGRPRASTATEDSGEPMKEASLRRVAVGQIDQLSAQAATTPLTSPVSHLAAWTVNENSADNSSSPMRSRSALKFGAEFGCFRGTVVESECHDHARHSDGDGSLVPDLGAEPAKVVEAGFGDGQSGEPGTPAQKRAGIDAHPSNGPDPPRAAAPPPAVHVANSRVPPPCCVGPAMIPPACASSNAARRSPAASTCIAINADVLVQSPRRFVAGSRREARCSSARPDCSCDS